MLYARKLNLLLITSLFLFFTATANAKTSVSTSVTSEGNSVIQVDTNVQSESSTKAEVSVSNATSTSYSDSGGSKTFKKMEITVNGKKKVFETTDQGEHTLSIIEPTIAGASEDAHASNIATNGVSIPSFSFEKISLKDYLMAEFKKIFTIHFPFYFKNGK